LLATSSHSYQLRSGLDGSVMQTYDAWGPTGRLVDCGASTAAGNLTFLTGHARRLEVASYSATDGGKLWRAPVWSDPAPHAAAAGVDTLGLGTACGTGTDGRTFVVANAQLYSGARGFEVVPILGAIARSGSTLWLTPQLR